MAEENKAEDSSEKALDELDVKLMEYDEEDEEQPLDHNALDYKLDTHKKIRKYLSGELIGIDKNYAKVSLLCTYEMAVDEMGLTHGGFTFGAADFAAMASVNEPNVVLIGAKTKFLAPAKTGDTIIFEAHAKFNDARKRDIHVIGTLNEIKIFEGTFAAVILEKHVLKVKARDQQVPSE